MEYKTLGQELTEALELEKRWIQDRRSGAFIYDPWSPKNVRSPGMWHDFCRRPASNVVGFKDNGIEERPLIIDEGIQRTLADLESDYE